MAKERGSHGTHLRFGASYTRIATIPLDQALLRSKEDVIIEVGTGSTALSIHFKDDSSLRGRKSSPPKKPFFLLCENRALDWDSSFPGLRKRLTPRITK